MQIQYAYSTEKERQRYKVTIIDVQVLKNEAPHVHKLVTVRIAETSLGVSLGIYKGEEWTDEDGHARIEIPDYDDFDGKYLYIRVMGIRYGGPWDLAWPLAYTV